MGAFLQGDPFCVLFPTAATSFHWFLETFSCFGKGLPCPTTVSTSETRRGTTTPRNNHSDCFLKWYFLPISPDSSSCQSLHTCYNCWLSPARAWRTLSKQRFVDRPIPAYIFDINLALPVMLLPLQPDVLHLSFPLRTNAAQSVRHVRGVGGSISF